MSIFSGHTENFMRATALLLSSILFSISLSSSFVFDRRNVVPRHRAAAFYVTSPPSYIADTGSSDSQKVIHSQVLGDIIKLNQPIGDDQSFLSAMAVPTFASFGNASITMSSSSPTSGETLPCRHRRCGLEGVLRQGPAFVLDNVISKQVCEDLIDTCERQLNFGSYHAGKNHHGALQIVVSQETADSVASALCRHVDVSEVSSIANRTVVYAGLNRRWRIYRYAPDSEETFAPHIDAGFPPSGVNDDNMTLLWNDCPPDQDIVSRLTVLMYLNDDFVGGETKFYQPRSEVVQDGRTPEVIASVRPVAGSLLIFPQAVGEDAVDYARHYWPLHEGARVTSGNSKYVIRSDVLFATQPDPVVMDDEKHFFEHDALVRDAFLPKSPVFDQRFLHHLSSLYNPHMGVENVGPLLYSFVRFTKVNKIVEIGAGYTSLWILQALKDNEREMERIRDLHHQGKCRLLDYPWVIDDIDDSPSSLLCIDNCLHQKETATGAAAVARNLGLESYMTFSRGDAFELDVADESVDVLWCDFGVGSRMREFVARTWSSIRPGGFLLCHSTLTNQRTREWLEAVRARKGEAETGMPPGEYVELSLLEPHKHYQNSISIFQKRRGMNGMDYKEPLYSEYA